MGKTLYLECYWGISGDMTAAALLDLGADEEALREALASLPVGGYEIKISRVIKSGIDACDFDVALDELHENHDHDMEYLHGRSHMGEEHSHGGQGHKHAHHEHMEADDVHSGHGLSRRGNHRHEHRGMKEIRQIIGHSGMTEGAKKRALSIFEVLAAAEARAHGVPVEEVHFHEVGAVDSIVDIAAVAVCLDNLDVTEVIVPVLCEGNGTVRCQHGILPIPVPAVANIIQAYDLPVRLTEVQGELVTPTGAAIVAAIRTQEKLPEIFSIRRTGIGAGKRSYECPGILRAMLIEEKSKEKDVIYKLESNIDDCSGEALGFVMEQLFAAGARDVHYIPVFMKKNRPAWILTVICKAEEMEALEKIIFRETTTIGIRRTEMERSLLKREQVTVQTPLGGIEMKACLVDGKKRFYPEYESVVRICRERNLPYAEVYHMAVECSVK